MGIPTLLYKTKRTTRLSLGLQYFLVHEMRNSGSIAAESVGHLQCVFLAEAEFKIMNAFRL